MRRLLTLTILLLLTFMIHAQNKINKNDEVYSLVDKTATPKIAKEEYYSLLASYVQYPDEAKRNNITGKVYVEFIINGEGKVTEARVVKGIGHGCDEIALNAVKKAGDWNPGILNNNIVKQKLVLPINFSLE